MTERELSNPEFKPTPTDAIHYHRVLPSPRRYSRNTEPVGRLQTRPTKWWNGIPAFRSRFYFRKEHTMKTKAFILANIALLALGVSSATSGPCSNEIDSLTKTLAAKDAGSGPTAGAAGGPQPPASASSQHPPTSIMRQQTEDRAASPEDVRRQTEGRPTAAQQGTTGAAARTDSPSQASSALDRARALDKQGKEAECMEAIREAKQHVGSR